jgi:cyclopropane fatty-acyl-phospholipid synthase-like methyltransferase
MKTMGINMQILCLQAIPRLAQKLCLDLKDFLTLSDLYGTTPKEFQKACDKCEKILNHFIREGDISWRDVYLNSDIGMERIALVRDIGLKKEDTVLEVGCGRGYFTIAAARFSKRIIGLDLMNGMGRYEWWKNFKEIISALNLKRKISGLKADAQIIPTRDCSISKVVAVHCIRNFKDKQAIQNTIREMYRVLSKDGEMVIVENIPVAKNKSQEAHLALYKCKCKYSWGDLFYLSQEELLEMFRKAGLREVQSNVVDYNLSATPPSFYLNASLLKKEQIEKAQREYTEAIDMIKKYGENSPPALIIKATKHPK